MKSIVDAQESGSGHVPKKIQAMGLEYQLDADAQHARDRAYLTPELGVGS